MDLEQEEFGPVLKPNDTPIYVNARSNHPPKVIENILKGINRRLSTISATKQIFDNAAPVYQAALEKSGHKFKLSLEENVGTSDSENKRTNKGKRSIIWFNPPLFKSSENKCWE